MDSQELCQVHSELHPHHNTRDVLRRRKKFLGYTDLRTPIPSFDTADTATAASSVRDELARGVLAFRWNGAPLHSLVTKKATERGVFLSSLQV